MACWDPWDPASVAYPPLDDDDLLEYGEQVALETPSPSDDAPPMTAEEMEVALAQQEALELAAAEEE